MVKTVATRTKRAIKDVAQRSIEGARSVAGEALGAAAINGQCAGRRAGEDQAIDACGETGGRKSGHENSE